MRFALLRSLLVAAVATTAAQQISLPGGGKVTGIVKTSAAGTTVQVFRGIPYAEPPTGERRWKVSTVKPLAGDVNATAYGNVCYGDGRADAQSWLFPNSEDCLFLNVFTPAGVTSTSNLPVMVWIHGGSFSGGAGNWFDGTNLVGASGNKVVYVSINYRLSVFGFLSSDALKAEGNGVNYGIRDQATAFQWVQQNIAHFGGNPKDITAFGESAGGKSVTALLLSGDGNQKLFHKAITESGSYTSAHDMPNRAKQNSVFDQIATKVGCTSGDDAARVSCLRAANTSTIWSAGGLIGGWQPIVDKVFLLDSPIRRVLDGKMSPVPTIFGTNTDEGYGFVYTAVTTNDALVPYLKGRLPLLTDTELDRIVKLYPATNFPSPQHRAGEIYGDYNYVCPSELSSLTQAKNGRTTFRYRFNETSTLLGPPLSLHTAELRYVFNNESQLTQDAPTQGLVKNVQHYWTNFGLTGSPNGAAPVDSCGDSSAAEFLHWPQYDATARQQIVLQSSKIVLEKTGAYMPLHDERCQFWYEVEQRLAPQLVA